MKQISRGKFENEIRKHKLSRMIYEDVLEDFGRERLSPFSFRNGMYPEFPSFRKEDEYAFLDNDGGKIRALTRLYDNGRRVEISREPDSLNTKSKVENILFGIEMTPSAVSIGCFIESVGDGDLLGVLSRIQYSGFSRGDEIIIKEGKKITAELLYRGDSAKNLQSYVARGLLYDCYHHVLNCLDLDSGIIKTRWAGGTHCVPVKILGNEKQPWIGS